MPYFSQDSLKALAARPRARFSNEYCGSCQAVRRSVYVKGGTDYQYTHVRICLTCGYTPGRNPGVPRRMKDAVWATDNYECVYCGSFDHLHADHVIPHAHGGPMTLENLVTSCRSCNLRKSDGRIELPFRFGRFRK